MRRPDRRPVFRCRASGSLDNAPRNADVGNLDVSAERLSGKQEMARLPRHEGYGAMRLKSGAERLAASSIDTRRQIDCQHRHSGSLHRGNHARDLV
ncbi:hypothetical protein D3C80_748700 [compost metagenome]